MTFSLNLILHQYALLHVFSHYFAYSYWFVYLNFNCSRDLQDCNRNDYICEWIYVCACIQIPLKDIISIFQMRLSKNFTSIKLLKRGILWSFLCIVKQFIKCMHHLYRQKRLQQKQNQHFSTSVLLPWHQNGYVCF